MDNATTELEVLHICPDFPNTKLYNLLIKHLMQYQKNVVYVSATKKDIKTEYPVYWGRDFGVIDRLLFFRKQYIIKREIEKLGLCNTCNIIHAHNLFSAGYTAWKLFEKFHKPYVVAVRNTDVNVFFHYMIHLRSIGVKIMRDASAVVFISPAYKKIVLEKHVPEKYRELINAKSYVIPNGIDDLFLNNKPLVPKIASTNDHIRLIYVGEVNTNKNITTTLKACELLEEKGFNTTLTVVGPITDSKYGFIKENRFVKYHPKSPKEEVLQLLRENDIFVMPSLLETFGLVYVEALSQGLPIIYSEGQGIDGYFEEGYVGYHVESTNAAQIADKVESILAVYPEISARCIEAAHPFSWYKIAGIYNRIYLNCINNLNKKI